MRSLDAAAVAAATPYGPLIDALADAFRHPPVAPLRTHHEFQSTTVLIMPCAQSGGAMGLKVVTVTPANSAKGLPVVQAEYLLGDSSTGAFTARLDGTELTLRRTAATSALASRWLSRESSERLLIVGAGSLAAPLARAHSSVRPIREIRIWNRSRARAAALAGALSRELSLSVSDTEDLEGSTRWADIVSCATSSTEPLVLGRNLRAGQHLDLVGAYLPTMRETDDDAVARARVFVDSREAALAEAGDLIQPLRAGRIATSHIVAELSDLARGDASGRTSPDEITLFKSVGLALEDLAAAQLALRGP